MTDPKEIMKQLEEAITTNDYQKIEELLHEDYTYENSEGLKIIGKEAGVANYKMMIGAFPDISFEIKNVIVSGNFIVSEFINRGTFKGVLNGIMPTNRSFSIPACNVVEIRNGKIYTDRDYYDSSLMMKQLGVETGMEHHA